MNTDEKTEIRKYLLGSVPSEEKREAIEERLMTDEAYFTGLLVEEEELIQDYADGDLGGDERLNFEKNFLLSDERRQKVIFSQALGKYAKEQKSKKEITEPAQKNKKNFGLNFPRFFSAPFPAAIAALVIVALSSFIVWKFYFHPLDADSVIISLNKAYQTERPLQARITRFNYAPFIQTRGAGDGKFDTPERRRAELLALNAAAQPTAANLQTSARIHLAKKEFDEAIRELEKAAELDARNAEILSDTGTAYLEKSKDVSDGAGGKSLELAAKALDYFDRAVAADPNLPEARFNRAISLQVLHSPVAARDAWRDYLNLDNDSPWAEEARQNLKSLDTSKSQNKTSDEIMRDFLYAYRENKRADAYRILSRNREMIKSKLVSQQLAFLFLKTADPNEQQNYLAALAFSGDLEKENSGDAFFSEIAKFYSNLPAEKRADLAEAAALIQEGYALCLKNKNPDALDVFTRARAIFNRAADILEVRFCDYWIGYCLNRSNKIEESTQILMDLADFSQNGNYHWLAAQAFSWLSVNAIAQKKFSKAIDYNRRALDSSEKVSDLYLIQKSLSQLTDTYRRVGDYRQATNFAAKTLEIMDLPEASRRQKSRDFNALARMFFRMKNYGAALAFQKESLDAAIEQNEPTFIYTSYSDLGLILGAQEKYTDAFAAFAKAREAIENFTVEDLKKKSAADVHLQEANVLRAAKDYEKALKNYDEAASFYDTGEFQANLYEAHKGRLICYFEQKNNESFQNELPVILNLFRDYRTKILEEQSRSSFFDDEQSVYDIAVGYEFERRNYEKAYDYSAESRARSLLDSQNLPAEVSGAGAKPEIEFSFVVTEPLKFARVQAEMPDDAQIVQYSVLNDRTLIWLITKNNLRTAQTDISASDLQKKTANYLESVTKDEGSNGASQKELAAELYRILIAPIEDELDAKKTLCLIPDKILFRLSFAALVSPIDEKFLVASYKILISPSADIFLIDTKKAGQLQSKTPEKLLSVGNPSFNQKDFASLSKLDSAQKEAEKIGGLYDETTLLIGKDASKERVKAGLPRADIMHFAGHYLTNENSSLLSGFVLAENEKTRRVEDSILTNYEIVGERRARAKLIVLSACETGAENFYNGEGMTGAARAFLAIGVPLVVASQWKVDSEATSEIMIRFHRYRTADKLPSAEALRRAQIDMLEGANRRFQNPYYWAGFVAFGGDTQF